MRKLANESELNETQENHSTSKKILLGLMPYWDPLIPPTGISCLKSHLEKYGFKVKTIDPNTEKIFKGSYHCYFDQLKEYVPEKQRGNFYNVGHDVLRNHMMAFLHHTEEKNYIQLVKTIIYQYYFTGVNDRQVGELTGILEEYFLRLENYMLEWLEKEQPGVLGLTVYIGTLPSSLFAFRLAKEKYPGIATVMGGGIFAEHLLANSSSLEFFLEKTPYIDKIIIGEGEELFLKLLRGELPGSPRVSIAKTIKIGNPENKNQENKNPENQDRENQYEVIDSFEVPDYSDFNTRKYPYLAVSGSISCPHECSFCNYKIFWGEYRQKQTGVVVKEMSRLYQKHKCQLFYMADAILNPNITELAAEIIHSDETFYYDAFLKVDELTCQVENTLHWRRGGFYRARLGIESGSQHVLDLMEKPVTIEQIKISLANLAHAGIKTTCFWIMGHPGETEADFQHTLDLLEELKDDIYEAECAPFMYFYSAQNSGQTWLKDYKNLLLFPREARDQLLIDTWILDCQPSRQETFRRIWRFIEHINRLRIPNPYSMYDIYAADQRWKNLHANAVPMLVEFRHEDKYIDECKRVK